MKQKKIGDDIQDVIYFMGRSSYYFYNSGVNIQYVVKLFSQISFSKIFLRCNHII